MVQVINEGQTKHKIFRDNINDKTKEKIQEFKKDYIFEVGKVESVPKEDFNKMINPDDFRLAKVYTKEQWQEREKLVGRQLELQFKLDQAYNQPEKQIEIRKEMILSDEEAYLLETPLPHEV